MTGKEKMNIYLFAYTILIFVSLISLNSKREKKIICWFGFVIWSFIIGLRHPSMGVDLQYGLLDGYWGMYSAIGHSSWSTVLGGAFLNYERGYVIFNKILSYVSEDPQLLICVCAIIAIGAVSYLIYKNSRSVLLSIIIYLGLPVFLINYSGLRQAVAIAITVFSYHFIKEKKPFCFTLTVLFAAQFHSSAYLFWLAYPVYYIRTERFGVKILSILLLPVIFIIRLPLFKLLTGLFGMKGQIELNTSFLLFVFFVGIYIACVCLENKSNEKEIGCRNLFYIACICQAFSSVSNIVMRVGYYYMIYLILLLPEIVFSQRIGGQIDEKRKKNKITVKRDSAIMYIFILFFFIIAGLSSLYNSGWAEAYPHSFFW